MRIGVRIIMCWGNPVMFVDPSGRSAEWVPGVDDDGNVTYTSEADDSYDTFVEQYGKEAADKTFNQESVSYNDSKEYGEGEVVIKGETHSLIIKRTSPGFFAGFMGVTPETLNSIQDMHNQLEFAKEKETSNGSSTITMSDYFTCERCSKESPGGVSFTVRGALKTKDGNYNNAAITYSADLPGSDAIRTKSEDGGSVSGGHRMIHSNSSGGVAPLSIMYVNKKKKK